MIEILGSETRDFLTKAGYPAAELTISDRRLEISNTNLEELRDGLASVLADCLAEISAGVRARQDAAAVVFQKAAASENARAATVTALAESVTFARSQSGQGVTGAKETRARSDRAQIDDWTDEGGHGRS